MRNSFTLVLAAIAAFSLLAEPAQAQTTKYRQKVENSGAQLGTGANQKLSFHGATPVVQRAGSAQAAVGSQTGYVELSSLKGIVFTGAAAAGNCTATGLAVGDVVVSVVNLTDATQGTSSFESTITVLNQIQQTSASNLSTKKFLVIVGKNSTTDIAALRTLVNEIRSSLVEKGLIKGSP